MYAIFLLLLIWRYLVVCILKLHKSTAEIVSTKKVIYRYTYLMIMDKDNRYSFMKFTEVGLDRFGFFQIKATWLLIWDFYSCEFIFR